MKLHKDDFTLELTELIIDTGMKDGNKIQEKILKNQDDAEKFEIIESLFAELEIPTPYDLWLANSKQWKEKAENWDRVKEELVTYGEVRLTETQTDKHGLTDIPIKVEYNPEYKKRLGHVVKKLKEIVAESESSEEYVEPDSCYGLMKDRVKELIKDE